MDSRLGRLILITGLTAAGKTTVGRHLASKLPRALHIDGDAVQRFVVSGAITMDVPPPPGAVEQLELRYAAALLVAALYRPAGFDVIVSDNIFEDHVKSLLASVLDDGDTDRAYLVMLNPTLDAIRRRYDTRPGGGHNHTLTPEALRQAVQRTPRIGMWLDTSDLTADETAAHILDHLDEATVTGDALAGLS